MSAQAYDTVFVINNRKGGFRVREVWEEDELNDYYERKENIVIVPQAEYNSLLEWLDKEILHSILEGDRHRDELRAFAANDSYQYAAGLKAVKEKLTSLNTK